MGQKKKVNTYSLKEETMQQIEAFRKEYNISTASNAVETIIQSFLKEDLHKNIQIPSSNAALIPIDFFKKSEGYTEYAYKQLVLKGNIVEVDINDSKYIALESHEIDAFLIRYNSAALHTHTTSNIQFMLEEIGKKLEIQFFSPLNAFEEYKKTESYVGVIDATYAVILKILEEKYRTDVHFFEKAQNNFDSTVEDILTIAGEEYKTKDARNLVVPLIDFIIKAYSNNSWKN